MFLNGVLVCRTMYAGRCFSTMWINMWMKFEKSLNIAKFVKFEYFLKTCYNTKTE